MQIRTQKEATIDGWTAEAIVQRADGVNPATHMGAAAGTEKGAVQMLKQKAEGVIEAAEDWQEEHREED